MKERPILFSGPMVRAILAGTKTQTRRVSGLDVINVEPGRYDYLGIVSGPGEPHHAFHDKRTNAQTLVRCRSGQTGDRLWVREAWKAHTTFDYLPPRDIPESHVWYMADDGYKAESRYRQGMFMPRWASRITLEVTGERAERLQDISEADAKAEGCQHNGPCDHARRSCEEIGCMGANSYRGGYADLWEQLNGPGSWEANPWVWVIEFKRLEGATA